MLQGDGSSSREDGEEDDEPELNEVDIGSRRGPRHLRRDAARISAILEIDGVGSKLPPLLAGRRGISSMLTAST